MRKISSRFSFICLLFFLACNNHQPAVKKTERGFYYWKSVFNVSPYEKQHFDSLHASTLYLKFFDVDWNAVTKQPNPVAQVRISDASFLQKTNLVPVVFITNECIAKIDSSQVDPLAVNIAKLLNQLVSIHKLDSIREIQIDCDWTASTKNNYFNLLQKIKSLEKNKLLSATIRLHQIKFISRSGIPPVDKGLLMCYNMGNLKKPSTTNSIIDPVELKKYTANLPAYPLKLDIALPLFEWKVLYRNNVYAGLIQNLPDSILKKSFTDKDNNRYTFLCDTLLAGYSFKKRDMLRSETSDYHDVIKAGEEISKRLSQNNIRVSLYHLDSITLSKYSYDEIENIYNSIH